MSDRNTTLDFHEAAALVAGSPEGLHAAEEAIIEAIEHGRLRANVKRWATEQWKGRRLPGNINGHETHIELSDLEAWLQTRC